MAAAARAAQWQAALSLLGEAEEAGAGWRGQGGASPMGRRRQDAIGYSAAMHGCVRARRWSLALGLLTQMFSFEAFAGGVTLEGVVNPAISACEAGHQWQLALTLFEGLGGSAGADSLNATAAACSKGYHWQQA
eukprot:Skav224762  [mRNA]  locus=scaffold1604:260114:263515:+ [translate_table: standard]